MSEQTEIKSPENGTVEGQKETSPGNYIYLYYYTRPEFLESILTKDGMKVSITGAGNDPLEGDFASDRDWDSIDNSKKSKAIMKMQNLKGMLKDRIMGRVFCLSGRVSSPLMWGHYAAGYTGACLAFKFDIKEDKNIINNLHTIQYIDQRIDIEDCIYEENDKIYLNLSLARHYACFTKISDWSYEREFRLLLGSDNEENPENPEKSKNPNITIRDGMLFSDYLMPYLDGVILGPRCSIPIPIIDAWLDEYTKKYRPGQDKPKYISSYLHMRNKDIFAVDYGDISESQYIEMCRLTITKAESKRNCILIPLFGNAENEKREVSNIRFPNHIHDRLRAQYFAMEMTKQIQQFFTENKHLRNTRNARFLNYKSDDMIRNLLIEGLLGKNYISQPNTQLWKDIISMFYLEVVKYIQR